MDDHRLLLPYNRKTKPTPVPIVEPPRASLHCTVNGKTFYRKDFQSDEAWREATKAKNFSRKETLPPKAMPKRKKSPEEKAFELGFMYGMGPIPMSKLSDEQSDRIFEELQDTDLFAES